MLDLRSNGGGLLSDAIEITGHLMDTGILSRVLDDIREYDGDYVIELEAPIAPEPEVSPYR